MKSSSYLPRVADRMLQQRLESSGAVLIEGPKACGKTATASRVARSEIRLDVEASARAAVGVAPELLFNRDTPILFDEWQTEPALWNLIRRQVDDRSPERGLFILTGSATPNDDVARHSGAGRIATLRMRPMSLFESGHSTGAVSLAAMFSGESQSAADSGIRLPALVDRIVIGGWPTLVDATTRDASEWVRDYLQQIVEVDIPSLGARRDPVNLRRLLRSLGRNIGTDVSVAQIARDLDPDDESPISRDAVYRYLDALERLMLTEDSPAWAPHMRSTTPMRKSPTRYMVDPSLAVAALGVGPEQLLEDLNATGFHFEGLAVRDLRIYSQPLGGTLHHWRDNNQHEVDAIVTAADGRWGAFEIKMNPDHADKAVDSLIRFKNKVDVRKIGEPAFLGVITTTGLAYRRADGVDVIPIGTLGP